MQNHREGAAIFDAQAIVPRIYVGTVKRMAPDGPLSGIYKDAVRRPVFFSKQGIEGDHQGDTRFHGGPDRAVFHYASEHYALWKQLFPAAAREFRIGSFGENLATTGMTEANVCIGDRYRLGAALLEVAQPRRPCIKVNIRFGDNRIVATIPEHGVSGWFYRVLEEGLVEPGNPISLVERQPGAITIAQLWAICRTYPVDTAGLQLAASNPALADIWARWIRSRAELDEDA